MVIRCNIICKNINSYHKIKSQIKLNSNLNDFILYISIFIYFYIIYLNIFINIFEYFDNIYLNN